MSDKNFEEKLKQHWREEADSIPVPDSLHPAKIEEMIDKKMEVPKKRTHKKLYAGITAAAACLALLIAGTAYYFNTGRQSEKGTPVANSKPTTSDRHEFVGNTSYSEIYSLIQKYHDKQSMSDIAAEDSASTGAKSSTGAEDTTATHDYSETDLQVKDVMEGDIVKTDGSFIYTMLNNNNCAKIRIYSVEGKTIELVKQFTLKKRWVEELYLENSKLIILSSDSIEDNSNATCGVADDCITLNETTYIDIYDVSTPQNAKKIKSLSQSGIYKTSRFTNGYLYTFSAHLIMGECKSKKKISEYIPSVNGKTMKENKIQKIVDDPVNSYVVMTSVNLTKPDNFSDTAAVLSDYTTYYMSTSHLYLANTIYEQFLWNSSTKTAISKFEYKDGAFSYQTTKKVKGQINDSYYMHEYKGNFAFVYTDWRNETSTNGICILDKNMNTLGKIDNLGNDETIYASYYIGSMAYFVTYRQTDPVFAVDISNPKKPVVKAKLKLPGFSSYLHSFGENQLIGVGMAGGDDDKVKISLFALGENGSVTEQTKLLLPKYSETEAGSNHKSVFIDEERKLVGFATIADTTLRYKLYHFDGTEFKQVLNVPIKEMSNTRGIRIGNYFYVVDNAKKIHAYDMQTWK